MTCPLSLKMTSTESAILCFLRLRSTCEQHLHLHYTHEPAGKNVFDKITETVVNVCIIEQQI